MTEQVRSRERVASHGEVFTSEREVNAMLDLVKQETERVDSRFLEPACGDGNFLAEILQRKLEAAKKRATPPKGKNHCPLNLRDNRLLRFRAYTVSKYCPTMQPPAVSGCMIYGIKNMKLFAKRKSATNAVMLYALS